MKAQRIYVTVVLFIISIGLLSRKLPLPYFIGDLLYAMMIFFLLRTIFIKFKAAYIFCIAIVICFTIEFSQLIHEPWLTNLRHSWLGRHILGSGFLWTDLIAYFAGAGAAYFIDKNVSPRLKN